MGLFVNPDNIAFQMTLNSPIYVDKTRLIEYTNSVLNTDNAFICSSRPRRFGKSITANMLTAYYSKGCKSEDMFLPLEISKSADFGRHLNQYDVIRFDVQWCMMDAGLLLLLMNGMYLSVTKLLMRKCRKNILTFSEECLRE